MQKTTLLLALVILIAAVGGGYYWWSQHGTTSTTTTTTQTSKTANNAAPTSEVIGTGKTRIVFGTHWSSFQIDGVFENNQLKSKGLKQYMEEYVKLHPEVSFEVRSFEPTKYHQTLQVLNNTDQAPDIYQIFSQWGAPYVDNNMLDTPPAEVVNDVKQNYISSQGVTVNGKIYGIPTEINDYVLVYNKKFYKEAGINNPPTTWEEFVQDSVKTTKRDANGQISRYGMAFLKDDYELVADPFMGLLFSNNGKFVTPDLKKSAVNDPAGIQTLDAEKEMFTKGATDISGNFYDFANRKVAAVISPPWLKTKFRTAFGDQFEQEVGVAPMPYLKHPATLQYGWFMGVMNKSQHKKEAWDFLKWISEDVQPTTHTTRYGDLLANTIGAIPARKIDQKNEAVLQDFFTKMFIQELPHSQAVPNVEEFSDMRLNLMNQIQAAWTGQKTTKQALDDSATFMNTALARHYK